MSTRSLALALAAGALAVGAASGCGDDDGDGAPAPRPAVKRVSERPAETTPLASVRTASLTLPGGPDWLAAHGDAVFVKRDSGLVTRVDAASGKATGNVRAEIKSEDRDFYCQGIGAGGGAVWSCSGSDVVRIDPERMRVTEKIAAEKVYDQGHLVFAAGRVWVLTGEGDRLVGIDPATNEAGDPIELPAKCGELSPGGEKLWVVCPLAGRVIEVDPARRVVGHVLRATTPSAVAPTPHGVWVASDDGLTRLDARTLKPTLALPGFKPGPEADMAADGDVLWVRTEVGFLHRIDARTGAVLERIVPRQELSGGSLLVHGDSVWTSAFDDGTLLRLRR